ncbi:unnamed protein product [Heligmosomoides polygyrus]|uniref:Uncharacterized protein n=1 Tax=Heligmosomoides polygyrus TaxID=6339 RepID=A0A3P7ZP24_HELPZ|nr:unnamed protein product [Heligmosomoides polygyrus]
MGRERYRLRAHGEEQAAEELYEKRSLIEKHVEHAHEIVFNDRDIIDSVRAFIEERFSMRFGPDMGGSGKVYAKVLSEEEKEEQEFLIEHSIFITRVILRMNNFEPDDYKSKIQNFHLMAKNRIVFYEKSVRDMEMDLMNEKRQAKFRKQREDRLMRIRGGQESSDDELLEEEVVKYDQVEYLESHTPEVVERLRAMMTEMGLNPSVDRLLDEVKNMLGQVQIKASLESRERCPSPPRNAPLDLTGDESPEDLPWSTDEQSGGDELLTDEAPEDEKLDIRTHFCTLDWSEDLFPDEDVAAVGEKRPIHASEVYG